MAGAIAGSAILELPEARFPAVRLDTVALTVNNRCNLACPHCYLQYRGPNGTACAESIEALDRSTFRHLAIVGKEPLVDDESAELCRNLAARGASAGRSTSIITNGVGLHRASAELVRTVAWIDVSLDGGPDTYRAYRRGSFDKIRDGVADARALGLRSARCLFVLNSETIHAIDDMMVGADPELFDAAVFSLYVETANHGTNSVLTVRPLEALRELARVDRFREHAASTVLIDAVHLEQAGTSVNEIVEVARTLGIERHVRIFERDPLEYGFLRLTYDGLVLAPLDSLHPAQYLRRAQHDLRRGAKGLQLEQAYLQLRDPRNRCPSMYAA